MGAAAADIVVHALDNLVATCGWICQQQSICVHKHPRSTESALNRPMFEKGALKRMESISIGQTFYGDNFLAADIAYGETAGTDRFLIDDDGARSAEPLAAAEFGPGKIQVRAENPKKLSVAFDLYCCRFSVECEFNGFCHIDISY